MGPQDSLLLELLPFQDVYDTAFHLFATLLLIFFLSPLLFFPISLAGFYLYQIQKITVSYSSILALF